MPTSTRLRGNINPIFTLKKGAGTATSYADDLKKYEFTPAEKDGSDLTFYEAQSGTGIEYTFKGTAVTSHDTASLFAYLESNVGQDVTLVFGPHGNATATTAKPHYTGTTTIKLPPGISNEARTTPEGAEFEFELVVSGVSKITA